MVKIVKMNGQMDEFSREKAVRSCERAGASPELCGQIVDYLEKKVYSGMHTREILNIIHSMLKEGDKNSAVRYGLKEAISKQDPEFHEFEFFVARLLRHEGYKTQRSPEPMVEGHCIEHEIDVVATRGAEIAIVECKHHYRDHTFTGLDVPMRQWARLDDIVAGYRGKRKNSINATCAWVVTNTKYSEHARRYARCRAVKLIGWNYPREGGLNKMIEKHHAYPLTMAGLSRAEREKLVGSGIFNVLDFLDADAVLLGKLGFDELRARRVKSFIERLINSRV